jgi:hypothetical protein
MVDQAFADVFRGAAGSSCRGRRTPYASAPLHTHDVGVALADRALGRADLRLWRRALRAALARPARYSLAGRLSVADGIAPHQGI